MESGQLKAPTTRLGVGDGSLRSRKPHRRFELARASAVLLIPLFIIIGVLGCGGGSSGSNSAPPSNPLPSIGSLSPSSVTAGGAAFTLTVNGTNFISNSTVQWSGSGLPTTFVSATQLTAAITAADIAAAGSANVTVVNPSPGGGTSAATSLAINNPAPSISSLSPASALEGGPSFTLTVNGSNFVSNSTVQWNGASLTTTVVSATQLTAPVTPADTATAGTASVTVVNPVPGGGTSSAVSFAVDNPLPVISSLSPVSVFVGGPTFTLTVNGTGFVTGSTVAWDGNTLTTTYVSATQLTASIPASDIATTSMVNVAVVNASPGGGTSTAASFAVINNPLPSISSLFPASASAGGAAFVLTVNGSNFVSTSIIAWNGNSRTTSYISATQVSTTITAADIATSQDAAITVLNPAPGGGSSAEAPFAVDSPAPTVLSISPSTAAAGDAGFTLTVNGSNFLPNSTVQWNGSYGQPPLSTSYVSPTELTVTIPASDIAFTGNANVTVVNPAPAGGVSQPAVFTITGSIPSNVSFVAPNGNDANPGTITQPYLTIQMCATTVSSGDICAIRAGTYRETVTPNSGITITSYDGEPVTVDGSNPVTGWTLYQGSIYEASIALSSGDTNQVFVGNQMMTEARWPNGNDLFHVNWATLGTGTTTTQVVDPNLPNIDWTGAKIHFWSGTDPWDPQTGTVTASSQGQFTFTPDGADFPPYIQVQAGGYYYLYRTLGALTAQQQWYYDPTAMVLYFWAPGNVNPSTLNVLAKQRQYAFDLSGQSNVTVEYVNLFASSINMNASSTNNTLDGINVKYVSQFTDLPDVAGSPHSYWYDHISDTGIILNGSGNTLENSTIAFSAGNGVALFGNNNVVKNNLIRHVDYMANCAAGVVIGGTNQEIQNNTVYAAGRTAVFPSFTSGIGNDISYNNLYNAMMLSRDSGEIEVGGPPTVGLNIHNNWLHDTQALVSGPADDYALPGVYLDEDDSGFTVDQNVMWNNETYNIFVNGSNTGTTAPNNNYIHNNTIPDVGSAAEILVGSNGSLITNCGTTQIVDNLVFLPVNQSATVPPCSASDNSPTAPGATQMTSSVQVGCNFAGCSSEGPPAISGTTVAASIAVQPYDMTVTAGQPVTFTVTGAGSPTLVYQWQRNGSDISGATSASYTTPSTTSADNGSVFTVTVGNSVGAVNSNPATLTVN